jgi:hypothetical protein
VDGDESPVMMFVGQICWREVMMICWSHDSQTKTTTGAVMETAEGADRLPHEDAVQSRKSSLIVTSAHGHSSRPNSTFIVFSDDFESFSKIQENRFSTFILLEYFQRFLMTGGCHFLTDFIVFSSIFRRNVFQNRCE